ncbi:hypothetical protein HZB94_03805 [Candidatus Falkowbacteria bacterium]|nr:hypothetical protein [Candidatus Falkowbacteria bacterium]
MKQFIEKISKHGKRGVHFGITLPVIALVIFSLVDIPLFTMAQELKMETPIVHIYKIAQVSITASTDAPTAEATTVVPITETKPTTEQAIIVSPAPIQETTQQQTTEQQKIEQPASQEAPVPTTPAPEKIELPYEKEEIEFIDPREVQNALQDIKRMQSDLKRFTKQLKKVKNSADDIAAINELLKQLAEHGKLIKNPPADMSLREALQDFWNARLWEEVDQFRAKAEIPNELKNIEKDLKRLKKMIIQKPFKNLGFDMALISQAVAEIETAFNETKTFYNQGNMEDALMALDTIRQGMHPGELMGIFYQTREIKDKIGLVKNKEVKAIINELLAPVIESVNDGDYRTANQILNEIRQELFKIMSKFMKQTTALDEKTRAKLDALEEMIGNKLNKEEPNKEEAGLKPSE